MTALYLLSRKDAPRGQILRLPLAHLDLAQAKVIVPQVLRLGSDESARASIENFVPTPGHLYVIDIMGGPSRVRVFDDAGPLRCAGTATAPDLGRRPGGLHRWRQCALLHCPPISIRLPGTALTPPAGKPRAPRSARDFPRQVRRRRSRARIRHLQRRHPRAGQHHPPQGHQARRQQPHAALRLRRLRHQREAIFRRIVRPHLAGSGRRLRRTPTSAAAANTARSGTRPATSLTSRTSLTTSSPAPNI